MEFVELSVARERMQQAVQRLMGGEEAAEKDIERWDKAIRMNPRVPEGDGTEGQAMGDRSAANQSSVPDEDEIPHPS